MTNPHKMWAIAVLLVCFCGCGSPATHSDQIEVVDSISPAAECRPVSGSVDMARCRIVLVHERTLSGSVTSAHPDPGNGLAMTTDGVVYTIADNSPGTLLMWSSVDSIAAVYEKPGNGPGELSPVGRLWLFPGPADSLYVFDAANRWTVFAPGLRYARQFSTKVEVRERLAVAVLPAGQIVTASADVSSNAPRQLVQIYDGNGNVVNEFAPLPSTVDVDMRSYARPIAVSGPTTFWMGPPAPNRGPLTLEEWNSTGAIQQKFLRAAKWWPEQGYRQQGQDGEPPLPEIEQFDVDAEGRLWLRAVVRDRRWRQRDASKRDEEFTRLYDVRLEVMDSSGRLLAEFLYDGPPQKPPSISGIIPRSNFAYHFRRDSLDIGRIDIYRVTLLDR